MLFPRFSLFDADPGAGGGGGGSTPSASVSSPAPSPAPSTPTSAPSGGTDLDAAVDAVLSASSTGAPAAAGGASVKVADLKPVGTPPAPKVEPTVEEPKPAEAVIEDPVEDPDDLALEDDSEIDSAMEDAAKPNLLDLKKPRGQRIYRSYKAYKAFTDALGHEPSVEDIRSYFGAFSDQAAMEDEFSSGDPAAQSNFLNFWQSKNPQAFTQMAGRMADHLAQSSPDAYTAMALPVLNRYVNALYSRAATETNPDMKKALTYTAQMADYDLRGDFRPADQLKAVPQATQVDQREAAINQKLSQITQYEQQQANNRTQNFVSQVNASKDSALDKAVEPVLKSLKATLPARVYAATANDFKDAVKQHLAKDADAQRLFDIRMNQSMRTMSSEDKETLTNQFMQRASRAIRTLAPAFLKEAGVAAVSQNTQVHKQLEQQTAAGAAPNSAGRPVQQSIIPTTQQFASRGEEMESKLDALLGVAPKRR